MFPKPVRVRDRALLDRIKTMPCLACGSMSDIDPAHVITRGAGGNDAVDNVMPLCREHHIRQGAIGWVRMSEEYPEVFAWFVHWRRFDVIQRAQTRLE